jgi:hypothetical protein
LLLRLADAIRLKKGLPRDCGHREPAGAATSGIYVKKAERGREEPIPSIGSAR